METTLYSILHMLTDGLCAFAMFAFFKNSEQWYLYLLLYNFCAFALQLVFGALMDFLKMLQEAESLGKANKLDLPMVCTGMGLFLTAAGALLHPAVLGIGNALFHVGGGIRTIENDRAKRLKGQALGIFVAPGALGLFLGGYLGEKSAVGMARGIVLVFAGLFVAFFAPLVIRDQKPQRAARKPEKFTPVSEKRMAFAATAAAVVLAFAVVVLRSYAGMSVSFSWKTGFAYGLICTLAVVFGKMAGGILAARFGTELTIVSSLVLAAYAYYESTVPILGIAALFFFNMTMPITLYMIVRKLRDYPGFSFGLLTLALFLGFLPTYFGVPARLAGNVRGAVISVISLFLLLAAVFLLKVSRRMSGEVRREEKAHTASAGEEKK